MTPKILAEIKAHALEEAPKECVGFVVQTGRKLQYVRAENVHEKPTEHFRTKAEDWGNAEDRGVIVRVIHSHPGDGARAIPSGLDKSLCNASGVVWGIYAPGSDEYAELSPENPPLEGRAFILGHDDCWGLIMAWHAKQNVILSDWRVNYPWWEDQYPDNLYYDNWEKEGFIECDLCPGAMVIMQISANKWNHAGIITEDGKLLHHLYGNLSCIIPYGGYFEERTMICVRHKDLAKEIKPWRD